MSSEQKLGEEVEPMGPGKESVGQMVPLKTKEKQTNKQTKT